MARRKAHTQGKGSRRPVMLLLNALGKRWTLRIIWELRDGALTFRALRSACDDVSPTTLNARLEMLRELGVVEHQPGEGYALTRAGVELGGLLLSLQRWARKHIS